ncbi:MAG: tetratricopeptide repeat protein [Sphingomonas sp.]|nr:tetratricopeptide repeat protein [Sphingomonas sp.]
MMMNGYAALARFLEQDPENLPLIADAAQAAFDEGDDDAAARLIARHAALAPLPPALGYVDGMLALRGADWARAAACFEPLLAAGHESPAIRYNLAWAKAMQREFAAALDLLDDATADALPQAAELQVELLHQLGELDRAGARARELLARFPDHRGLNAAASTLAIDLEDEALARATAAKAGDHPEALITQATLALRDGAVTDAARLFEVALERAPRAPRAWVGQGLVMLQAGDAAGAATALDRGAELFADHLGSWIASGWAHLLAGDVQTARDRFERARALDDTFSEAHGSLAVIDLLHGETEAARRHTEVALRLDRQGFAGALAATLLKAGDGDPDGAQRLFERALTTPIDQSGLTVAGALARMGLAGR